VSGAAIHNVCVQSVFSGCRIDERKVLLLVPDYMEVSAMSVQGHQPGRFLSKTLSAYTALVLIVGASACIQAQDAGAPRWGEYLKKFNKDKLLKKPFHMEGDDKLKGLASRIRARELDIPNRKKAIRYLRELDCVMFPEAKQMLLDQLKVDPSNPDTEKWEEIRYEAALGLEYMLARHSCCGPQNLKGKDRGAPPKYKGEKGKKNETAWQQCCNTAQSVSNRARGVQPQEPCHCRSCCDAKTLNTLAKTAYEIKDDGCWYEPSARVRAAAAAAIKGCGIPCHYGPYRANGNEEIAPTPADDSTSAPAPGDTNTGSGDKVKEPQQAPQVESLAPEPSASTAPAGIPAPMLIPTPVADATPISRLQNLCVVSLKAGVQAQTNPEFSATHKGRVYYFASREAEQQFRANPDTFAVAFGGCDPVDFVESRQIVEGRFLVRHGDRFFMFSTRENHNRFKTNPSRYSGEAASGSLALAK
jgi:YHS domain-containing protein